MTVEFIQHKYQTNKQILMFPDHKVAFAHTFKKNDAAATTVGTRKIIKAGTIYPQNDATAIGVVENDVDVTDGDRSGALLIHAFINSKKIPAKAQATAKAALPLVVFMNEEGE